MNLTKKIASLVLAGFLICGANFNVFAAENDTTREVEDEYKTCYEEGLIMTIKEEDDFYNVYSIGKTIEWTAEKTDDIMYTSRTVFARQSSPNINNTDELCLPMGTEIHRIGISDNGWDIVEYEDEKYFIWYDFLSEQKIAYYLPTSVETVIKEQQTLICGATIEEVEVIPFESEEVESYETTAENSSNGTYLGTYQLTAYEWTGSPCANGNYPTCSYTVACNSLPLGTKIYIEGYGTYVVEDRGGMGNNVIDIYMGDVSTCLQFGRRSANVYIVD